MFCVDFDLVLGVSLPFWGPNEPFLGVGVGFQPVLGSSHVVE